MIWKSIKGFEQSYDISDTGLVRSKVNNKGKLRYLIKKTHVNNNGYEVVPLSHKGKRKLLAVHRIVALAFIPNPENYPQINHKNENKLDNTVANLEWCTSKYNCQYGSRTERMRMKRREDKRSFNVEQIDKEGNVVNTFFSMKEAQRITGIRESGISKCVNGIILSSGGFYWRRINNKIKK